MRPGNAVKFPHVTLRLIPEILNPVNVILPVHKQCAVVYSVVLLQSLFLQGEPD